MRKIFSKIALAATLGIALAFTLSCGGSDGDDDPEISSSSGGKSSSSVARSSSSLPASTVLCLVNEACISLALEACNAIGGQAVQSCPASSSSSLALSSGTNPSSSSVARSSSSLPAGAVSCLFNGTCVSIDLEVCSAIGGQIVPSCPASSSSATPSSSSASVVYGTPVTYEGETYQTIVIGTQTWMARNLNYAATSSGCYDNDPANCTTYGRIYDWETAKTVCPSGWHLPFKTEWNTLKNYIESDKGCTTNCSGKHLKAKSGWDDYEGSSGNGLDSYDFTALPLKIRKKAVWWSASESDLPSPFSGADGYAWTWNIYNHSDTSGEENDTKTSLFSVRCLKN